MQSLREMLTNHWAWGLLMIAVISWYTTVTVYVAIRGGLDVRSMLRELGKRDPRP